MEFEEDLPSYSAAISHKRAVPWAVIAKYLPYEEYPALARVDRASSQIFTRLVWQQPDQYFATPHRSHVKGFFDFFDTVAPDPSLSIDTRTSDRRNQDKWRLEVRAHVRNYVRVIDLRFVSGGVYADPGKRWLLILLDVFPSLKVLRVDGRKFLDSAALSALARSLEQRNREAPYKLEFLSLAGCPNVSPQSLTSIFGPNSRFKALRVLDLSNLKLFPTSGTAGVAFAKSLDGRTVLPLLKIIKLRNCGVNEEILGILAQGWGRGVERWDLRDNPKIGSKGVMALLEYCFSPPAYLDASSQSNADLPPAFSGLDGGEEDDVDDDLSVLPRRLLPPNGTLGGKSQAGITRLRLGETRIITSDAVDLLLTTRLTHLDLGYLSSGTRTELRQGLDEMARLIADRSFPCALQYLRIDYRFIVSTFRTGSGDGKSSWLPPSLRTLVLAGIPDQPIPPDLSSLLGPRKGWKQVIDHLALALQRSNVKSLACEVSNRAPSPTLKGGDGEGGRNNRNQQPQMRRRQSFGDKDAAIFRNKMAEDFSFFGHDEETPSSPNHEDGDEELYESNESGSISDDERDGFLYNLREWRRRDKGTEREWTGSVQIAGPPR